jgi:hypothetical protein
LGNKESLEWNDGHDDDDDRANASKSRKVNWLQVPTPKPNSAPSKLYFDRVKTLSWTVRALLANLSKLEKHRTGSGLNNDPTHLIKLGESFLFLLSSS